MIFKTIKSTITLNFIEKAIIVFFGLSVFTSKAGLNISVVMLLLYFFFACITNRDYRTQVVNNNIFKLSITLYIVGLLSTLIYPTTNPDTIYFARKAAFLLTIPWSEPYAIQALRCGLVGILCRTQTLAHISPNHILIIMADHCNGSN